MTSRVALAADFDGSPILLLSQLSAHTRALATDSRLSLLAGEPGAGDPLQQTPPVDRGTGDAAGRPDAPEHERLSRRFTAHHPAAAHYGAFADFVFFRVEVASAFLNGGFARPTRSRAAIWWSASRPAWRTRNRASIEHMNADHGDVLDRTDGEARRGITGWRIATLDARGFELVAGSHVERIEFAQAVETGPGSGPPSSPLRRRSQTRARSLPGSRHGKRFPAAFSKMQRPRSVPERPISRSPGWAEMSGSVPGA